MDVALREACEESGIAELVQVLQAIFDLDIHRISARGDDSVHDHDDVRVAVQSVATDRYVISHESHALCWVDMTRFSDMTQESAILRMCQKWQDRRA